MTRRNSAKLARSGVGFVRWRGGAWFGGTASLAAWVASSWCSVAHAAEDRPVPEAFERPSDRQVGDAGERLATELSRRGDYAHTFASFLVGRGLRFNNPFRLRTVLGEDERSLSLTATFAELGVGASLGDPNGLQHGGQLSWVAALEGIEQQVVTPSYVALYRYPAPWTWTLRAGVPIVLNPDTTAGLELAAGGVWRFLAGLGLRAELVGDLFFGAATLDRARTVVPILSFQIGLWGQYEVLP